MNELRYKRIREDAELIADAIVCRLTPAQDIISKREAEKLFGKSWIKYCLDNKIIRPVQMSMGSNSKMQFSRFELQCRWRADYSLRKAGLMVEGNE